MINSNGIRRADLEILGVKSNIIGLFMSKYEEDFLIAWELIQDHPNKEWIMCYCKGNTSKIHGLDYDWEEGKKYYNWEKCRYEFENIIIDNQ